MSDSQRAVEIKLGHRAPKEWDRDKWLSKHKAKKLRAKPFEIPSSAEEYAELCRKAGFINVQVVEVKKDQLQTELALSSPAVKRL